MRKKKGAQVTIFIIIGIVVALILGVSFYLVASTRQQQGESSLRTQQQTKDLLNPVDEFVTSCLDIAATSGLNLLGKQGGVIYAEQDGLTTMPQTSLGQDFFNYDDLKVTYAIYPPTGSVGDFLFSEPPKYPWPEFPKLVVGSVTINSQYLRGYYGKNLLPQLYRPSPESMQEQLETFIARKVEGCVDIESFKKRGISIKALGSPEVTLESQEESVSFKLRYPLEIKSDVAGTTSRTQEFVVVYALPFERFIETVREISDADVTNLELPNQTTIQVFKDVHEKDDVVVISDPNIVLAGIPYEFRYARHNRVPALAFVESDRVCSGATLEIKDNTLTANTKQACGNDYPSFSIPLKAWDPDEDVILWKATHKNSSLPKRAVNDGDGKMIITVIASDGELEDYQDVEVRIS
jgi:hypothetical protein